MIHVAYVQFTFGGSRYKMKRVILAVVLIIAMVTAAPVQEETCSPWLETVQIRKSFFMHSIHVYMPCQ